MGIYCEINLCKPSDQAFIPGSNVEGILKYAIDENTIFKRITISLNGHGNLTMQTKNTRNRRITWRNHEDYVNVYNVIHEDEKGQKPIPKGSYDCQFSFKLPEKIPSTLHCFKNKLLYVIKCHLAYYIEIKFEKPSVFSFDKKFKNEIIVASCISPRLPIVPTICNEQKTLTQFFASKKSIVNIKATIKTCVLKPGEHINLHYEVSNDSDIVIKGVEIKLLEKYTFITKGGREVLAIDEVKNMDSKTGSIQCGDSKAMSVELPVPSHLNSLEYSKIVARNYFVRITAGLPMPHRDAVLEIPVQIGESDVQIGGDVPPVYWEAMAEDVRSIDSDGEEEDIESEKQQFDKA